MNSRNIKRAQAKVAYKKFCKNWGVVAREQNMLSKTGSRHDLSNTKKERMSVDGNPVLGQRPTFKHWWNVIQKPTQFEAKPEEYQEHIEEIAELEWDE